MNSLALQKRHSSLFASCFAAIALYFEDTLWDFGMKRIRPSRPLSALFSLFDPRLRNSRQKSGGLYLHCGDFGLRREEEGDTRRLTAQEERNNEGRKERGLSCLTNGGSPQRYFGEWSFPILG